MGKSAVLSKKAKNWKNDKGVSPAVLSNLGQKLKTRLFRQKLKSSQGYTLLRQNLKSSQGYIWKFTRRLVTFSSKFEKFTRRLVTFSSKFEQFTRPNDFFVKIWKVHKAIWKFTRRLVTFSSKFEKVHKAPCDLFVKIWKVHKAIYIALWLFRQNLWPFRQNLKSWLFCQNLNLKTFSSKFESSQGYSRFVKFGSKVEKNDKG